MIDAVVFDLGGVLIDWNPRYFYRSQFADDVAMEHFLAHVCNQDWNEQQDAGRTWREATAERVAKFPEHRDMIEAYPAGWVQMLGGVFQDTIDVLADLRARGVRLYALTNWSQETFPMALQRFDFLHWFEGIVVSGEERLIKPDPRIFQVLFERHHIDPERALYVDDSLRNVEASQALGMRAWHFTGAEAFRQWLASHGLFDARGSVT